MISLYTAVEGWVIVVTNVNEEATEEEVIDKFIDFGKIKSCHLNLDRRTGYVKVRSRCFECKTHEPLADRAYRHAFFFAQGYALLEFDTQEEAQEAIQACKDGLTLLEEELKADFTFVKPPAGAISGRSSGQRRANADRDRSRSPGR